MIPGSSPGVMPMINGHRSPVFGGPVPIGAPGMSPSMPLPGMPIPMGGSPRQGAPFPVSGTPPYRNASTPLNRQSPGMLMTPSTDAKVLRTSREFFRVFIDYHSKVNLLISSFIPCYSEHCAYKVSSQVVLLAIV